jgi:hypothetical protein
MVIAGTNVPRLGGEVKVTMTLEPQGTEGNFEGYSMSVPKRPENFIRWFDGDPRILDSVTNKQQVRLSADQEIQRRNALVGRQVGTEGAANLSRRSAQRLGRGWSMRYARQKLRPNPLDRPGDGVIQ